MSSSDTSSCTVSELKSPERLQGEAFESILLLKRVSSRTARNNNPFLVVELGDKSGAFTFTCFNDNPVYEAVKNTAEGTPVRVRGEVEYYQNRLSPRVVALDAIDEEELSRLGGDVLDRLVATSREDADALMQELFAFIEGIGHEGLRKTVEAVIGEIGPAFKTSQAAISMHHAYRGGLLEHTIHMARVARSLSSLYPEVDPDLAMSGILLHDVGKTLEYEGNLAARRSRTGVLQGHVVLGYRLVRKAGMKTRLDPDLLERLEHIVLSHQGEMEWGAAAMAATPEAVFVSMIDNLDARMGMVQQALRDTADTAAFSDYIAGLKAPLLVSPPHVAQDNPSSDD